MTRPGVGGARRLLAAVLAAGCAQAATAAQPAGGLIIDRNRIDRAPPTAPLKPAAPAAGVATAAAQSFAPFRVREVRLEGATAPSALVGLATRPFIGRTVDARSIDALPDAVAKAYALTDVALYTVVLPRQDFAGGVVRIVVVEGRVEAVAIHGRTRGLDMGRVRAYAAPLTRDRPLRRSHLQRAIALMQAIGGLKVDAQFLPGRTPGGVTLALGVSEKRVQLGLGISDRGQNLLGRTQLEADLTLNSLLRQGDQTLLTFATPTDPRRFQYYGVSHSEPIGDDGLTLAGSFGYLRTRPRGSDQRGEAETASLTASYPVILSSARTLSATLSLDGLNSSNALFGQTLSREHTRALRAAAAYAQAKGPLTLALSGSASFGLDVADARTLAPGYDALDFKKLSGQVRLERKAGAWTLRLHATGQYSPDLLPASEQLALGGDEYGRAFPAALVTGDEGAAGSAELGRLVKTPLPALLGGTEVYGFVDGGRLRQRSRPELALPGRTYDLASTGLGVRLLVAKRAQFDLEGAHALQDPQVYGDQKDWRLVFAYKTTY